MKRIYLVFALSLALVACAGSGAVLVPSSAPALQGITGVDALMGVPCASANYFRIAPHICKVQGVLTSTSIGALLDTTCRTLDLTAAYGIPTSASMIGLWFPSALAATTLFIDVFKENTCTTLVDQLAIPLTTSVSFYRVQVPIFNGQLYIDSAANYVASCGGAGCTIKPFLYYD